MTVLVWRCVQLVSVMIAGVVSIWAPAKTAPVTPGTAVALSFLGQRERPDGSWEGVDLLRDNSARIQRAQLSLRLEHAAEVTLEAVDETGRHTLYPPPGSPARLKADRTYAFPAPGSFYEVDGTARLRLTVRPLGAMAPPAPLVASGGNAQPRRARLSDGARFEIDEQPFHAQGSGTIDLLIGASSHR